MYGNYQSTSNNQKASKTLVNENTDTSSSTHSASIQTSSIKNAGNIQGSTGLHNRGENLLSGSDTYVIFFFY